MFTLVAVLYLVGVVINLALFLGVMRSLFSRSWPIGKCLAFALVWPAVWVWEVLKDRLPRRFKRAGVMIIVKDGLILAVSRRHRTDIFGLPGGKFNSSWPDNDKDTQDTAIRETQEETSVTVSKCVPVYGRLEPADGPNGIDFYSDCYYALDWAGEPKDSDEGVVKWLTAEELTSTHAAFGEYNTKALAVLKNLFPDLYLKGE